MQGTENQVRGHLVQPTVQAGTTQRGVAGQGSSWPSTQWPLMPPRGTLQGQCPPMAWVCE